VLDSLSPARRRVVLLAVLGALLAALVLAALLAMRVVRSRVTPVAQDRPGPVLLVSGYGGATAPLEPIRRTLLRAGRDVVVVTPLGDGTGDLRAQAADLGRQATAARERSGAGSVDVVGYSAGGLVARSWVRDFGGAASARRVLSIGTPHHGTSLAELAVGVGGRCPAGCRQLRPGSDFLRALNAGDETPRGPVFVSVWSTADRVVVPPSTARLAGALNLTVQSLCPAARTAHGDLPSDPVVQAVLGTTLGAAAPRVPTRDLPCRR
jgi:triacylglycerol esterase/lipase EstA (alpha/beta hydrolase family)